MWDIVRFAEQAQLKGHPYKAIVVENVVDVVKWGYDDNGGLFNAWLMALRALGYQHECVFLNSMMSLADPQSRDRMYVVFWRKTMRRPNLRIDPRLLVPRLRADRRRAPDVEAASRRPELGRVWGRYGAQYFYTCTECHGPVAAGRVPGRVDHRLARWPPSGSAIATGRSAQNTRERIRRGLERLAPSRSRSG